jgi:hypothetical protein
MADSKPTDNNSKLLGGVNQKSSEYSLSKAEFLNLRNLDFDVPNALQKRPGSTQMLVAAISGPVMAMHEHVRLSGESTIIAATDNALFYMNGASAQVLDLGWSNGQPPDMLTFLNKAWIANGSKFYGWTGPGATPLPAGLPAQASFALENSTNGPTFAANFSIFGITMGNYTGLEAGARAHLWAAVTYVRADGFQGPIDIVKMARSVGPEQLGAGGGGGETLWAAPSGAGSDFGNNATLPINMFGGAGGFTAPAGYGITAAALYFMIDTGVGMSLTYGIARSKSNLAGTSLIYSTPILKSSAPTSAFKFFTLLPIEAIGKSGIYIYGATNWLFSGPGSFSLMTFGWFNTNIPKYLEVNQNSMFYAGFSQNPSNVWFSELGAPEVIEPESFFEVRTNDGDKVYAIKAFNNETLILKQNSFHKVIGDSSENFQLIELTGEYGCISNASVIEYKEKLCWLDQKGIVQYNGASWDVISTPVEDIFRRMNVEAAKEKAVGVHYLDRNQVWWGIPLDNSTENNITVVYDYLVDAWTFFDGFNPASFAIAKGPLTKSTLYRGDYSGMIFSHSASFLGDNGQGITCLGVPHWDKNKENETWIWRRFFLDVATSVGLTGTINGRVFSDYNLNTAQATFSFPQNVFQSRAEMGVVGKAVTAEFAHFSASLPLLINKYSWAKRFLRNV